MDKWDFWQITIGLFGITMMCFIAGAVIWSM
jgi:hypothetical protein